MKKVIMIFLTFIVMFTTIAIVQAQAIIKQKLKIDEIKQFLNSDSIDIMNSYVEDDFIVYKVYDESKDEYYKLAMINNTVNWYDIVKYGQESKLDDNLKEKMNNIDDKEKIPVVVEMSFDYTSINTELASKKSLYFTKNGLKENLDDVSIVEAKKLKKNYIKEVMIENNQIEGDYEVLAISEYSPFMFLNLTKDEIKNLEENEKVFGVGLFPEKFLQETNVNLSATSGVLNNNAIKATRTNLVKDSGMTGSGIKIGQIETSNPNTSNSYLSGKKITKRTTNCLTSPLFEYHSTEVAGILVGDNGVAPNASLYSACYNNLFENDIVTTFVSAINWIVSQNVDIINMSAMVQNIGSYNTMDRWIDAIAYMNDILFVTISGNTSDSEKPENNVVSPGLAYNVITVGNITETSDSYVNAMSSDRHPTSKYNIYGYNGQSNKPELVAPGTNVNYTNSYGGKVTGTSFAAPLVAGASALLMQSTPSIKNDFRSIKAALFATARPMNGYGKAVTTNTSGWLKTYTTYNNGVGLGILDTKAAYDLLRWNQFRNVTINGGSSDSYTYNNTLGNGMDVRVAITWSKPNTATSHTNINNCGTDKIADLDLQIIGPNGEKIARSISSYDNVEMVNFITSQGYGTYKFKIINYATNGNTVPTKVSMAWW